MTAHISTDVAAAPLLWVLPLSLYLLTWVLVFQSRPLLPHQWMLMMQPVAIAGVMVLLASAASRICCSRLVAIWCASSSSRWHATANSRARVRRRSYLTGFYVALSFGGMVGGLFAGLIAPYTFSWIAEYPILLALSALCRPPETSSVRGSLGSGFCRLSPRSF